MAHEQCDENGSYNSICCDSFSLLSTTLEIFIIEVLSGTITYFSLIEDTFSDGKF